MSAGKGSAPRPFSVPRDQYERAHESIFGKRERQQYVPPPRPGESSEKSSTDRAKGAQ